MNFKSKPDGFMLVGRFPLDIKCKALPNVAIIYNSHAIRINQEIDSPTFLYSHEDGFFIQVASQTNGCITLLHENDIKLYKDDKQVGLYDINVQPVGEIDG